MKALSHQSPMKSEGAHPDSTSTFVRNSALSKQTAAHGRQMEPHASVPLQRAR
jgi:hypothetical protein